MGLYKGGYEGLSITEAVTIQGPVAGMKVGVPATGDSLKIDMSVLASHTIRISSLAENIWYVFAESMDQEMIGPANLPGGELFQTDIVALVPDIIWSCTSVREVVPKKFPWLLLRAEGSVTGKAVLRRA